MLKIRASKMTKKDYIFELLIIDPNGNSEIQSTKSLLYGLLSTEKLWEAPEEIDDKGIKYIKDKKLSLRIKPVDTSSVLYNLYESAFIIKVKSSDFEKVEKFRYPLVLHLKSRLRFDHIRILTDDISTEISNEIYPLINELENILRRYLAKFFTQKVGLDWWKQAVPDKVIEKTKLRQDNETVFSKIVETDMTLIDFNDLGEIIYKHKLGFNKPENLTDKILSINSEEELQKLKQDLDGNYNRFFKQHFKDFNFEKKWKQLFQLRNKVAHNNLFTKSDLDLASELYFKIKEIILNAENKIDEFRFSIEEQEAMIKNSNDQLESEDKENLSSPISLKVVGKIDLPAKLDNSFEVISEEELLNELVRAEESLRFKNLTFIGLKSFVTNILGAKGYSYGPTYAQINVLKDKGKIEIYDIEDGNFSNWPVKAIRLTK
ncbi:HEPN domain-containing protein [Riemerella anatipestifer]|uniref:Uncharacterized protein n=2 Tax=Riemerella anatipestifer TaxID=34085 RepID=J9QYJ1_RIEAN|nr:HEPN domain-containing protein [Riemerella anatipestifer]AFR35560.1 hypothetical protein B739_0960 [Riemerella anatipestifer RA-CH-1]AIH02594.1 hypothetical protein M949_1426 [Riemerella anatipestifer CH3]MCU7583305.1 HEPN domain-containing protein [Riemerella anatipestifer]MCW0486427.1 HEPN domain-containing protein [Riemerella anatipestifer]MDD1550933.1 hypothetical protein [Riemerella anatipestifer]